MLLQIVTGLPPKMDGVGDYAVQIARQLRDRHHLLTHFLVMDPEWEGDPVDGFRSTGLKAHTSSAFADAIEIARAAEDAGAEAKILLHYVPHGYQKRGAPLWLARAVEAWHKERPGTLSVMFHEVSAVGMPPWSSDFWVAPLQRMISVRLAKCAEFRYTNIAQHRDRLEGWGSGPVTVLPVCSSMGEPATNPPFSERLRDVVVFGRAHQRQLAYERGGDALRELCREFQVARILDIGSFIEPFEFDFGVPTVQMGCLPAAEVSETMGRSFASFLRYPVVALGKSTIYAASCAHGTIPFLFDETSTATSSDGLEDIRDFVRYPRGDGNLPLPDLESISNSVFVRYEKRASRAVAERWANDLGGCFHGTQLSTGAGVGGGS